MMNLELLFWAFRTNGDSTFYQVAVDHARTTMKNHFRKDYSSYHVIDYDTLTGAVLHKNTHQGIPMLRLGRVDKRGDCTAIRCAIEKLDCLNFWNVPNKLPLIFFQSYIAGRFDTLLGL